MYAPRRLIHQYSARQTAGAHVAHEDAGQAAAEGLDGGVDPLGLLTHGGPGVGGRLGQIGGRGPVGPGGARRGVPAGGHLQGVAGGLEGGRVHGTGQVVQGVAGAPVGHARRVGLGVVLEGQEPAGPPGVDRGAVGGGQEGGGLGQVGDGVVVGDDDG